MSGAKRPAVDETVRTNRLNETCKEVLRAKNPAINRAAYLTEPGEG